MELVSRARGGDVAAFTALVRQYEERVYNLAYRMTGSPDAAADVAQEAFLAAYEGLANFRAESAFYTWLYRITVNKALGERRARAARRESLPSGEDEFPALDAMSDGAPGPDARAEEGERAAAIQAAISALPPDYRTIVILKDVEGLEYEEIAEVVAIPVGTVKSRLHRGRMLLREALKPYLGAAS